MEERAPAWMWWSGPAAALVVGTATWGLGAPAAITAAVTAWTAVWWMLEPVDSAIASLLPMAILPLAGVLTPKQVAEAYGNDLILLLAGGFILSTTLETHDVHRRLALWMLRMIGGSSGRRVLFGFGAACAVLSMFVSNTGSTLMMLPVAQAVLQTYPDKRLEVPLVLMIAYGASIGGLGTPIGTPPNLVFIEQYAQASGVHVGFGTWMGWDVPIAACMLVLTAAWLGRGLSGAPAAELPTLPPMRPAERRTLVVFGLVSLGWALRTEPLGGWAGLLGVKGATDATVALLGVLVMASTPDGAGSTLLTWRTGARIPWGTLWLFAGGITIATGFEASGLSTALSAQLTGLASLPTAVLMFAICLGTTLLSEIASNTATAVLLMPVLAAAAKAADVDPAMFMLPAVLAASCGFALPVATGPNAVAYGSGRIHARDMMREGLVIDVVGVAVITLLCWLRFR